MKRAELHEPRVSMRHDGREVIIQVVPKKGRHLPPTVILTNEEAVVLRDWLLAEFPTTDRHLSAKVMMKAINDAIAVLEVEP